MESIVRMKGLTELTEVTKGRGGMTLAMAIEHDQVVAKRGVPSMPKLRFMNGTKWGKEYTDEGPRPA